MTIGVLSDTHDVLNETVLRQLCAEWTASSMPAISSAGIFWIS